ncbi:MAG: hypothetical protein N2Z21_00535 [Candidatus Sumerlaeaceae bacterium]|nr:hypothetical protein [Candidatus Sumerlaeaceae bacterium]
MPKRVFMNAPIQTVRSLGLAVILSVGITVTCFAGENKATKDTPTTSSQPASSFIVNLDPSGKPVQSVPANVTKKTVGSRHEGLVVEQNPAGGVTVDLKGRFQRAMTATKDAHGVVRIECLPAETTVSGERNK